MFGVLDFNHDGEISSEEFVLGMAIMEEMGELDAMEDNDVEEF